MTTKYPGAESNGTTPTGQIVRSGRDVQEGVERHREMVRYAGDEGRGWWGTAGKLGTHLVDVEFDQLRQVPGHVDIPVTHGRADGINSKMKGAHPAYQPMREAGVEHAEGE
ncbi:hypothetical protein [Gordonia sp. KTR9]|uniref:hypothetical protein n=1 Tax=Gordonia sp. KTR9 TaxID=337191 RepID=UPI0002EC991D|nr:hypothetical protein [Gordonia sp. KTR9]